MLYGDGARQASSILRRLGQHFEHCFYVRTRRSSSESGAILVPRACRVLFGLEAVLKISALGPRSYFSSKWLSFELIIVVVSVITAVLDVGRLGNLIRLIRVIKVLRVARAAPSLQVRMGALVPSPHLRASSILSFSRVLYSASSVLSSWPCLR